MLYEILPAVASTMICVVTGVGGGVLWSWFDEEEQPIMTNGIDASEGQSALVLFQILELRSAQGAAHAIVER